MKRRPHESLALVEIDALRSLLASPRFELIPLSNVLDQAAFLPEGADVSVTASPGKGIGATLDVAVELKSRGFHAIPHLAARMIRDRHELEHILGRLDVAGIREVFVVGGDAVDHGEFFDGLQLLTAMDEIGHDLDEIGVPGYPEGHHVVDQATMHAALVAKAAHASYVTTQMCFVPDAISTWSQQIRRRGVDLPFCIGIPGVAELRKLIEIAVRIGVGQSRRFLSKSKGLAGLMVRPGRYTPADLVVGLAPLLADPAAGVKGLHVYTFNRVETTERWRSEFLESLG